MKKIIFIILFIIIVAGAVSAYLFRDQWMSDEDITVIDNTNVSDPVEQEEIIYPEWYETDKDGDGILDELESDMGTDLYASDTDGDGISDNVEIETYGTDPTNPDTDGDSYWDGVEILNGYNPNGEGTL